MTAADLAVPAIFIFIHYLRRICQATSRRVVDTTPGAPTLLFHGLTGPPGDRPAAAAAAAAAH